MGDLTPRWQRFLVIPRYALRDLFKSKLVTALVAASFLYPLLAAILIYLHHNANAIALMRINVADLLPIDASFFQFFLEFQGWVAFILTVLIGPPLVSRDLSNNALPLYLCRPFSRAEYVLGKLSVLGAVLSLITWVPGLLLFSLQAYLEGADWLVGNLWIAGAIFMGSAVWILLLSLLALAVSAWVKWRVVASGALLGLFFVPSAFGAIVNNLFFTRIGHLLSPGALITNIWHGFFGLFVRDAGHIRGYRSSGRFTTGYIDVALVEPPLWASWLVLGLVCAVCLWLLARKVRAYEVVK